MVFYSFDTSAILNGRRDLLPPTVFRSLWSNIEDMISAGEIRCVDVVRDELGKRDDDAKRWSDTQEDLFLPLEVEIQTAVTGILADHPKLMGKGAGRNAADPFVIALAAARGGTVVTEERLRNRDHPRIPDVCDALNVPWMSLVGFVQEQGWTF